jgi:hypothetical protein
MLKQINQILPYTETVKVVQTIQETPVIQETPFIEEEKKVEQKMIEKTLSDLEKTAIEIVSENFMFNDPSITFEYIIPTSEQSELPISDLSLSSVSSACDDEQYLDTLKSYFTYILTEISMDRFDYKSYSKNHTSNRKKYQEMAFSDIGDDNKYIDRIAKDLKDTNMSACVRSALRIIKEYSKILVEFDIFYETMRDIFPENVTSDIQEMRDMHYELKL